MSAGVTLAGGYLRGNGGAYCDERIDAAPLSWLVASVVAAMSTGQLRSVATTVLAIGALTTMLSYARGRSVCSVCGGAGNGATAADVLTGVEADPVAAGSEVGASVSGVRASQPSRAYLPTHRVGWRVVVTTAPKVNCKNESHGPTLVRATRLASGTDARALRRRAWPMSSGVAANNREKIAKCCCFES